MIDDELQENLARSQVEVLAQLPAPLRKLGVAVERLNNNLEGVTASQERLSRKLFWLNAILVVATVVGSLATLLLALKELDVLQ